MLIFPVIPQILMPEKVKYKKRDIDNPWIIPSPILEQ